MPTLKELFYFLSPWSTGLQMLLILCGYVILWLQTYSSVMSMDFICLWTGTLHPLLFLFFPLCLLSWKEVLYLGNVSLSLLLFKVPQSLKLAAIILPYPFFNPYKELLVNLQYSFLFCFHFQFSLFFWWSNSKLPHILLQGVALGDLSSSLTPL